MPFSYHVVSTMTASSRYFPVLLVLFLGSGCSALIYEIVWYHMLQLNIGSTAISLGVLLATYMGGLCIGSAGTGARAASGRASAATLRDARVRRGGVRDPGAWVMPLVGRAYAAGAEHGLPSMLLRGVLAAICLLPPTILMGASLPAVARWIQRRRDGRSRVGLLYGANTVGAVFGCLLAGFYLLRMFNVQVATFAAAAINVAVAVGGLLARAERARDRPDEAPAEEASGVADRVGRLPDDRDLRRGRARRGGRLDAADGHAARLDGVCVLDHSGGVPDRARDRQRARVVGG